MLNEHHTRYAVNIDGELVGEYGTDKLRKDVNLAKTSKTPRYKKFDVAGKTQAVVKDLLALIELHATSI